MEAVGAPRAMRADARRNYERIVSAAREAFGEHGAEAPLDDIAKRAGVGAGTLYRHFPTRDALIEAVYRADIVALVDSAYRLVDELPPKEALEEWLREQVRFVVYKNGLAQTLKAAMDRGSETFAWCRASITEAASLVVTNAQKAGVVREDLTGPALLRLGHGVGIAAVNAPEDEGLCMVKVVLAGLRPE
ncbi:TetR/AcrR family transcriptional regulator [Amycolatopsis sp. CA-230715]|uniref:TetR/AcrR family transcriptional regulator n=1 Tax=Amycolatopsis sp. CA-230715 TaxID=2745196 RepID=UPI001C012701|nr:TetR/AcrR family transcriptional regulator [Amycolatopsis sp. CA-230715]QWF77501.1 hypothetical protein HUW46_00893 [Amycolatopsis sp. CA-230715]